MNIADMIQIDISISKKTGLEESEVIDICKATEKFLKFLVHDAAMTKAYEMSQKKGSDLIIPNDPHEKDRE